MSQEWLLFVFFVFMFLQVGMGALSSVACIMRPVRMRLQSALGLEGLFPHAGRPRAC